MDPTSEMPSFPPPFQKVRSGSISSATSPRGSVPCRRSLVTFRVQVTRPGASAGQAGKSSVVVCEIYLYRDPRVRDPSQECSSTILHSRHAFKHQNGLFRHAYITTSAPPAEGGGRELAIRLTSPPVRINSRQKRRVADAACDARGSFGNRDASERTG
ncbi:hypothetical protein EVAR_30405_1 [Eumeta japonica]|uniref:Uncharacterized protein n=1 Tax=Eumeta variegata TaxID=151549 RepID=A0A4C1W808_EUMVA|nr:hypothetical protein EVAR_30405_1 [Eumeta japonica]